MNLFIMFIISVLYLDHLDAYKRYTLENDQLCGGISRRTIKLGDDASSGLIVTQKRQSDHGIDWRDNFKCSFDIKTKGLLDTFFNEHVGLFIVIQNLKLRRYPNTFECKDYIQFKNSYGVVSPKYCGNIDATYAMDEKRLLDVHIDHYIEDPEVNFTTYNDPTGMVTVHIFINKEALLPNEETDLQIAFTSYRRCKKGYSMCINDRSKCIANDFFNDGIFNCPYYGCVDENGCRPDTPTDVDKPLSIGSHILIGSGTSLLLSFAIFVCCIYNCRKYGKLCWSDEFSRPQPANVIPSRTAAPTTNNGAEAAPVIERATLTVPSAPPVQDADKDLPPAYESLFPNVR